MSQADLSLEDKTIDILARIAETDEVRRNLDLELFDLDILDSLATVQLMVALSDEFGVDISPAEFEREEWATPRKIVAYMEQRVRG
ncbi:MAG: D-alanine--poly(phosphoribitol) ligase subunit DltC [Chloroflexi bacterium]|nr:D-alanine--poly(phosphoribitol) ligase subunit DltC [Chloroflexota bacterium]